MAAGWGRDLRRRAQGAVGTAPARGRAKPDSLRLHRRVIRTGGRTIVCETGIGTKLDAKRARAYGLWEPEGLLAGLQALGIRPEEVDLVLTTHLHWDHAGGFTAAAGRPLSGHLPARRTRRPARRMGLRAEAGPTIQGRLPGRGSVAGGGYRPGRVRRRRRRDRPGAQRPQDGRALTGPPAESSPEARTEELACVLCGDLIGLRPHLRLPGIPPPTWTCCERSRKRPASSKRRRATAGCFCSGTTWNTRPAMSMKLADGTCTRSSTRRRRRPGKRWPQAATLPRPD